MSGRRRVELELNGEAAALDVEPRDTLLDAVRAAGCTGAHAGCEHGACGACTVLLDGEAVRSCLVLAVQCAGRSVTTVEAFGAPDRLHPVMEAFRRNHGLQCGFCTPAMVLTAIELLGADGPPPDEGAVREALSGNLCRCTGYAGAVAAVLELASEGAS